MSDCRCGRVLYLVPTSYHTQAQDMACTYFPHDIQTLKFATFDSLLPHQNYYYVTHTTFNTEGIISHIQTISDGDVSNLAWSTNINNVFFIKCVKNDAASVKCNNI